MNDGVTHMDLPTVKPHGDAISSKLARELLRKDAIVTRITDEHLWNFVRSLWHFRPFSFYQQEIT